MGVGEVDPAARDVDQDLALAGLGVGHLDVPEHLGPAELLDLDRLHRMRKSRRGAATLPCRMSLTVVGSIAFDSVRTPFGERERMLGGAAVHFSLAASFFTEVRPVGPGRRRLRRRRVRRPREPRHRRRRHRAVPGGESFFWRGRYEYDLNVAHTEDTQLGVFGDFEPKLSDASKAADVLFLANIQPDLQRQVRAQCAEARFCALDSMNLWIDTARDSLLAAISEVDCVIVNDAEIRQLTGESNLARARAGGDGAWARARSSPSRASTAPRSSPRTASSRCPASRSRTSRDPTGAGDSFAGGFLGYLDSHEGELDDACLRRAMGYGTVLASFNVEEFGTERVARLTREEIDERFELLREMTHFDVLPASAK